MSFFRYPGGKAKLRAEILGRIEQNNLLDLEYREPFFGGGIIGNSLLIRGKVNKVWINDKDIGIACLWTSVLRHKEKLIARIHEFEPSVQLFYSFKTELLSVSELPTDEDRVVDIGFKKLAIHQISYSGLGTMSGGPLGGAEQKSQYKIGCRWSPSHICKKIDKFNKLFSGVIVHDSKCSSVDFEVLIKDEAPAFLLLDPPYYVKGNDLYQHGFSRNDHERLANLLKESSHSWLLSYDDCPEVRELYKWAKIETVNVNYSITALKIKETGERVSSRKPEVLICSK